MRNFSVFYIEKGRFEIKEHEIEKLKEDEVLVKCLANGVCMWEASLYAGIEKLPKNSIIGHEGIGIVVEKGKNVKKVKKDDYVVCYKWSLYQKLKEDEIKKFSIKIDDPSKYIVEPVACVINALQFYEIIPGDKLALIGAGFMGLLNLQGLSGYPIEEIAVFDVKDYNLKLANEFGATEIINVKDKFEIEKFKNRFDFVIECAGSQKAINLAEEIVNKCGKIAFFSWHHEKRIINPSLWHTKGLIVLNPSPVIGIKRNIDNFDRAIKLLENKKFNLEKLVTHRFSVNEIDNAMKLAIEKPEGCIKVILIFDI
ncbi:MAG: alcohol dehydrogenase catalytic domain-containing protein [Candidatus Omnitrophica bacterium]|nr:alcohol dehydrogenase catalytic domain-containing protein [Candidatus Omnitrophota bacterium]MCM8802126.1 alcohol dehydrogenase catalytic domain-containing protein [Candidatus Omnitrophota bacterium]